MPLAKRKPILVHFLPILMDQWKVIVMILIIVMFTFVERQEQKDRKEFQLIQRE